MVRFEVPYRDVMAAWMFARVDVVPSVLPEGFGQVVVASNSGGIPEIVSPGVDGLLTTPGDPVELADAIERVWRDDALHARVTAAGRVRAREFTVSAVAGQVTRMYRQAIATCSR